jgi:putative endonuclease
MNYFCYILYSKSINRYYTGYTSDLNERLRLHNQGHFGGKSFTRRASDWEIYLSIQCKTIEQAIYVESRMQISIQLYTTISVKKYNTSQKYLKRLMIV